MYDLASLNPIPRMDWSQVYGCVRIVSIVTSRNL